MEKARFQVFVGKAKRVGSRPTRMSSRSSSFYPPSMYSSDQHCPMHYYSSIQCTGRRAVLFFLACLSLGLQCRLMNHTAPVAVYACTLKHLSSVVVWSSAVVCCWRKWWTRDGWRGGRSQYKSLCFLPLPLRTTIPPPTPPTGTMLLLYCYSPPPPLQNPLHAVHSSICVQRCNCSSSLFSRTIRHNSPNPAILHSIL